MISNETNRLMTNEKRLLRTNLFISAASKYKNLGLETASPGQLSTALETCKQLILASVD
jgi:hypothetical protein